MSDLTSTALTGISYQNELRDKLHKIHLDTIYGPGIEPAFRSFVEDKLMQPEASKEDFYQFFRDRHKDKSMSRHPRKPQMDDNEKKLAEKAYKLYQEYYSNPGWTKRREMEMTQKLRQVGEKSGKTLLTAIDQKSNRADYVYSKKKSGMIRRRLKGIGEKPDMVWDEEKGEYVEVW